MKLILIVIGVADKPEVGSTKTEQMSVVDLVTGS